MKLFFAKKRSKQECFCKHERMSPEIASHNFSTVKYKQAG